MTNENVTLPLLPLKSGVVLPGMVFTMALESGESKAAVECAAFRRPPPAGASHRGPLRLCGCGGRGDGGRPPGWACPLISSAATPGRSAAPGSRHRRRARGEGRAVDHACRASTATANELAWRVPGRAREHPAQAAVPVGLPRSLRHRDHRSRASPGGLSRYSSPGPVSGTQKVERARDDFDVEAPPPLCPLGWARWTPSADLATCAKRIKTDVEERHGEAFTAGVLLRRRQLEAISANLVSSAS